MQPAASHHIPNRAAEHRSSKLKKPIFIEVAFAVVLAAIVFIAAGQLDLLEEFFEFSRAHEDWELDELAVVGLFLLFYFMVLAIRKWWQAVEANQRLQQANQKLDHAVHEIQNLRGIIPICARCKNIRDDEGYWQKVEAYLRSRADVKFTHGLCPECFAIIYPDLAASQYEKFQQTGEIETAAGS